MPDEELWQRIKTGDPDALSILYDRYAPMTYASFAPANAHVHTTGVVMLIHNKGTRVT